MAPPNDPNWVAARDHRTGTAAGPSCTVPSRMGTGSSPATALNPAVRRLGVRIAVQLRIAGRNLSVWGPARTPRYTPPMNPLRREMLVVFVGLTCLVAALAATGRASGRSQNRPVDQPVAAPIPAAASVSLTIDYKDGARKVFAALPHSADMTVLDVLNLAARHPHGITYISSGSGESAFVKQIDDLKNQGGGAKARNWQFLVNGNVGTRGAGATRLKPGDGVVWDFDVFKLPAGESK